ncbi:MAG: ketol-acid reductoisomerase [Candidatus Marinimicrobia bacterium]|nr:ketol-acid reductoisomerase [Candidatus Neomarinimicrobiota bacterium]|tara:strand:- start:5291 stop:6292 length:1002 start_codon:yes stop_codon:yes gene_type:complete
MVNVFYEKDADLSHLINKKIAVIGYGSQGHAHALNLKDSNLNVRIGLRNSSSSKPKAEDEGFEVMSVSDVASWSDVLMMLVPDQNQKTVYENEIAPYLKQGDTLAFAHGFNIHYDQIKPLDSINIMMIAPKSPGHLVRRSFVNNSGVPCLIAIHQDPSGNTKDLALAWAKGIGCTRAGAIQTNFKDETETDLFGEQAVLCGGSAELIKVGFETLVEAGYPAELAYFECLHELKLIVDLYYEGGLQRMNYSVSDTAEYGGMTRGSRIITEETRKEMKKILLEVQNGTFADEWIKENLDGQQEMERLRDNTKKHLIEEVGLKLRKMMTWLPVGNK